MLRDGLSPRLPRVEIHAVSLTSKPGYWGILIRVQRSWLLPHRVIFKDHGHFYSRNSAGKYRLDVPELRTAFEVSSTTAERIKSFRAERLSRIGVGEETPVPLGEQEAKLVLHIIPFGAFDPTMRLDIPLLEDPQKRPLTSPFSLWSNLQSHGLRYNLDGLVNYTNVGLADTPSTSYVQVFHNGIVEALDVSILNASKNNRFFSGTVYEQRLLQALSRYREVQKLLGVEPPWCIMVSLLGIKGYRITHPQFQYGFSQFTDEIDRTNLIIPEVVVDDLEGDMSAVMKPVFDTVWNAAGYRCSPNYDASGKCTLEL